MTAVLLAALGIYGVVAYSVTQRTREMGLRMALGANKSDVLRMVIRNGMGQIAVGLAVGTVGAVGVGVLLKGLLFEVSRMDPVTLVGVVFLLTIVGLAASLIPALRATRVDPIEALRYE